VFISFLVQSKQCSAGDQDQDEDQHNKTKDCRAVGSGAAAGAHATQTMIEWKQCTPNCGPMLNDVAHTSFHFSAGA